VILENGVIRTMDPALPTARALAIAGERIAGGVGTHETMLPGPERVDLRGRCVVPGFNDSHVHFPSWALARQTLSLEDARSLDEAVSRVREAVRQVAPGSWLRGRGWRDGDWAAPPSRQALDEVSADTLVALEAHDGHSLWLNTGALGQADGDLEVEGGVVERDGGGEPTGVLREKAAWRFRDRYVRVSDEEALEAMRAALRVAAARGVTAVHDKDGGAGAPALWQRLLSKGDLTLRVWQSLPADRIEHLAALGLSSPVGDGLLRIGYVKVFMDGTLGSRTARLLDGGGVEITSRAELADIVRAAAAIGWPVAVHAIGDRANRDALDVFAETREDWEARGLRPRIEHAQLLAWEDVPRFGELGVAASVQFSHAPSDRELADRYWPGMTDRAYAYRSLWEAGAAVANGSDAPIEDLDPLAGVRAAVAREWHPEQRLTVEQALEATTVTPAWLAGEERRRGKLLPGFLADLVVLDLDPAASPVEELTAVQVVATMLGGRWVHNPPPWD
jgi:predicted amidohydrolase YtcJ